jgi:hypothetical protein
MVIKNAIPWRGLRLPAKPSKYRNVPTRVDEIRFDSKKEEECYRILMATVDPQKYVILLQTPWPLEGGVKYRSDFVVAPREGLRVIDAKGVRTDMYRLKKKQMAARHGIQIEEM